MDIFNLIITIFFYIGWCIVNAMLADAKKRNVAGIFLLSLFLSPFLVWAYIGFVPVNGEADNIAYIANHYMRQNQGNTGNSSSYPAPAQSQNIPTFKPISTEQNKRLQKGWE